MKKFSGLTAAVFVSLWFLYLPAAVAQFSTDSPLGISAGFVKLFGTVTAFSARAEVQVLDTNRQETLRTPMQFSLLNGKVRLEFDLSRMQGKSVQPLVVAALKQANLNQVASILRLDQRMIHVLFPGRRSYVDLEMSTADVAAAEKDVQVQRTPLGKETVDGHACSKNRVVVKNSKGATLFSGVTWNATDLKEFPVKIAVQSSDGTTLLHFSQMQMAAPPAAQFEIPAGFKRYDSTEALFLAVATKQGPPPDPGTTIKAGTQPKAASPANSTAAQKPRNAAGSATKR